MKMNIKKTSGFTPLIALVLVSVLAIGAIFLTSNIKKSQDASRVGAATTTEVKAEYVLTDKNGIANQDGTAVTVGATEAWIGTGASTDKSFLGLHFVGDSIPTGAQIKSATIDFTAKTAWINMGFTFFGDKLNTQNFTGVKMDTLALTSAKKTFSENVRWELDKVYSYDVTDPIKELVGQGGKSSFTIIVKGGDMKYGRKMIYGNPSTGKQPKLHVVYTITQTVTAKPNPTSAPTTTAKPSAMPGMSMTPGPTRSPMPSSNPSMGGPSGPFPESHSFMEWSWTGKNKPNTKYDKCDDGTDVVTAHNMYYVIAYDGIKYPTWHPPVVTNPVTGVGKCYFGHEHGTNPQTYVHWNEVYQHFGKDINNDGVISPLVISSTGQITQGDRAGIPFGIANEHMDEYYNQENRDSIFVRHEDHVGHKIEVGNNEADTQGNSTHTMAQLAGTVGINIPYYQSGTNTYQPTGVVCTHLHKFHQGTHSGDAMRNNLHEVIFHSTCTSVVANGINAPSVYPNNTVILTGMMSFGNPGTYQRFCLDNPPRASAAAKVCVDGKNSDGSCKISDPLISKLPNAIYSNTLGRNMVDRYCLENFDKLNPGVKYFNPYEIWQGDLRIQTSGGKMLAEHGRQWDVLDPIRFVDPNSATGFGYYSEECNGLLQIPGTTQKRTLHCDGGNKPWDSPQAEFKGLHRTTYFGRNRVSNQGGSQIWWTDPLGGNAVTTAFQSGLKQKISSVEADIQKIQSLVQQVKGSGNFLNDRSIQRQFNSGGGTVHAPN